MRSYIIAIFILFTFSMCANQTSPGGGPQDKKAPELLSSIPKNNQLNFKGEKFELEFDEYIKLKDPAEEIMITPSVGKETKFIAKKNKVIIVPKNKLLENTTYSVSFRDGVQDISESNPAFNLRLAFSTGPEIDSLKVYGSVSEMFKEEIPEKITVALYQSDTFNIFNHQPIYFTRTDKKGKFSITNLKAGDYYIYAFDDKSKNLKVESKSERFGFLTRKIELYEKYDSIKIPLIRVDAREIKMTNIRHTEKLSRIKFNKRIDSLTVNYDHANKFIYNFGDTKEELIFYKDNLGKDSVKVSIHATDSVGHSLDTITYIKSIEVKVIKETFKMSSFELKYEKETEKLTATSSFNKPIATFTLDSMYVQIDSTTFQPITKKEITIDTLNHKLKIETLVKRKVPPASNSNPEELQKKQKVETSLLVFGKGAFISIEEDSSKASSNEIKIPEGEETGSLSIEVTTKEKNYIVQLLTTSGQVVKSLRQPTKYVFKNLPPAEYKIRTLIDRNNNGTWDVGSFEKRIEPEQIILYKTFDGKTTTPVRANWEVGPLVIKF
jgi:uncharacterized protein (DUF2141 family)/methionine-rich copper-binding protein CopC